MELQISAAILVILLSINLSYELQSSEFQTLVRIQKLLNYPSYLTSWNSTTDFCNTAPNPYATVVCYQNSITQLHIIGTSSRPSLLPKNFSIESFVTTLVTLPNLKVLTLSSLGLWGSLPGKIARLSSLEILNVSSNFLYDAIPGELRLLSSLQSLALDDNMFSGVLPDWIGLKLPGVLDLEDNDFGTEFPKLGNKLVTLVLSKNKFRDGLPSEISSFRQLQKLDISRNNFVGPFPPSLLALPSIAYLNIAGNKLTGKLFENQSCSTQLEFADLTSNFLTGHLPKCLHQKTVVANGNCLEAGEDEGQQNPVSFCSNAALAVGVIPQMKKSSGEGSSNAVVIALGVIGGVVGGIALAALIFLLVKKVGLERRTTRTILENASITSYPSQLLQDAIRFHSAGYISQTTKLGTLGLPAYRTFSLEEIEDATNNFESSAFIGESSQGQMYKGRLKDGSFVAIRCLKMKRSHSTQRFTRHIELISKLRHRHLVSALGHCFECYLDDSTVSRVFLVFEHVQSARNLRSCVTERHTRQKLNWMQRLTAAIGVAKGMQFLHTGIVPGVCGNNLKITDVQLDQNLVSEISSYNLPLLADLSGQLKNH
ncbi:Probable inactive leucine-rich repeat receptor-like protein kinase At3g03770 [Linum grandiflorum]